jgi:Flp pilus assembly protein TadB
LLGLVALVLAFGLALAVGRYESRRAAVVEDANAIGTTYLRAQTLAEPVRTRSLERLVRYTDTSIRLSRSVPGSDEARKAAADDELLQRQLWRLAGKALANAPIASAPRLYVETLNEMIDMQTVRVAGLNNRVPSAVLLVEVGGAAVALALLAFYLSLLGRGVFAVLLAASLITLLLLVTFDLDRPTRGLSRVPHTALTTLRASMMLPPAANGPDSP